MRKPRPFLTPRSNLAIRSIRYLLLPVILTTVALTAWQAGAENSAITRVYVPLAVAGRKPTPSPTATSTATQTAAPPPTQLPAPTTTPTRLPTDTPAATQTGTVQPTDTPAPSWTPTSTATSTDTPTKTPTATATNTSTPTKTPTATATNTSTPTKTPTATATSTSTPTKTPAGTPTTTVVPVPAGSLLKSGISTEIDQQINSYSNRCGGQSLGLIYGGKIVYVKTYGSHQPGQVHEWASVSKTATALATMHFVEQGRLELGTPIWNYASKYYNLIPIQYHSTPLTLKHLLTHTGGVNHLGNEGTSAMFIAMPGSTYSYSTNGFGIIGDVMKTSLNTDFPTIIRTYIGTPVGASSLTATNDFVAPGANVKSTIDDFARYAVGISANRYVLSNTLYNQMLVNYVSGYSQGLGFQLEGTGSSVIARHTGDNGTEKASEYIRPSQGQGVVWFCDSAYDWSDSSLVSTISRNVFNTLTSSGNPCADPTQCQASPSANDVVAAPGGDLSQEVSIP